MSDFWWEVKRPEFKGNEVLYGNDGSWIVTKD
jgi:hypothetical protein